MALPAFLSDLSWSFLAPESVSLRSRPG